MAKASAMDLVEQLEPELRDEFLRVPDCEQVLTNLLDEAQVAWDDIELDPAVFLTHLAERLPDCDGRLEDVKATDLYLACACSQGDPVAISRFEQAFFREVDTAVHRAGASRVAVQDLRQTIRQHLFVARPDGPPRIAAYSGRGSLRNWFRIIVVRTLINLLRYQPGRREIPADEDLLIDLAPAVQDPETDYLRQRYQGEFQLALREAVDGLEPRQRTLLRYQLLDGLGIDRIGAIYGVHRATAARWLARARDALQAGTRRLLAERLGASPTEFESIMRLIRSEMELRISVILASREDPA